MSSRESERLWAVRGSPLEIVGSDREAVASAMREVRRSLESVGPAKPVGYLPFDTIRWLYQTEPEVLSEFHIQRGLAALVLDEDDCCIGSGALYVYDTTALDRVLARNSRLLAGLKLPTLPEPFVRYIAMNWLDESHLAMPVIREAFGDTLRY